MEIISLLDDLHLPFADFMDFLYFMLETGIWEKRGALN